MEAYQLKPLVDGKKLAKDFETNNGPWVGKALKLIIAWQLENPDRLYPDVAISENKEEITALIRDEKHSRPNNAKDNDNNHEVKKKKKEKEEKK